MTDLSKINQALTTEVAVLNERIRELEVAETERKRAQELLRESEEKYRSLFNQSTEGIYLHDLKGRILDVNEQACAQSGYSREEWLGLTVFDGHLTNTPKAEILQAWSQWVPGQRFVIEAEHRRKDGTVYPVEISTGIVLYGDAKVMLAIVTDITERKQAEEALKKSEEMLRLITDSMSDMIRVTDLQGVVLYISPSHFKGLGYRPEERVGKSAFDIVHPDDLERIMNLFSEGLTANRRVNVEYRVRHAEGRYIWLETVGDLLRDAQGNVTAVVTSSRDVSDRRQVEDALREKKEQYRTLVENASDIVFRTDNSGYFTFVNPAGIHITGYEEKELIGKHYPALIRPDMRDEAIKFFGRQFVKGINNTYSEYPILTKDGHDVWLGQNTQLIVEDGHVTGFQAVSRDITDRKRSEEMLRRSEEKFRFLTENMNDNIFTMNLNLQTTYVSQSIEKILGFTPEERMQQDITEQVTPASMTLIEKILSEELEREEKGLGDPNRSIKFEVEYYHKDGSTVWMENVISGIRDDQGVVVGIHGVSRDITERKRSEHALKEGNSPSKLH